MTKTPKEKPSYQFTIKQHFHMRALLERFTNSSNKVRVVRKPLGTTSFLGVKNKIFIGDRCWSEEIEKGISWPIENAFLHQVVRVESGQLVNDHLVISKYHLLWTLRQHFASNPNDDREIVPGMNCYMDEEIELWADANYKMPIKNGGIISGRFATTLDIKELMECAENSANYEGIFWNVIRSEGARFISADQYRSQLLIVISPYLVLQGGYEEKPPFLAGPEVVEEYNDIAEKAALSFTFG